MKISVIIPVYNEEKVIGECLRSLGEQDLREFEVIVVDDGSTDGTVEAVKGMRNVKYKLQVLGQEHLGAGAARNLGAKQAWGEILVFVDADMTFQKNFLKKLVAPIVAGRAAGTWSGEEYVSNWGKVWARCWNYNEGIGSRRRMKKGAKPVYRAIKRDVFEKAGGFEAGGYTDDLSLVKRVGKKPAEVRGARFYHKNPESLGEVFFQARWVGKRRYKLGGLGMVAALFRVSIPVTKLVGVYKAIRYRTPAFFVFKIVYNTGVTMGIVSYHCGGGGAK